MHSHDQVRGTHVFAELLDIAPNILWGANHRRADQPLAGTAQFSWWRELAKSIVTLKVLGLGQPAAVPGQHIVEVLLRVVPGLVARRCHISPTQLRSIIILGVAAIATQRVVVDPLRGRVGCPQEMAAESSGPLHCLLATR